jgi:hypothetical protein
VILTSVRFQLKSVIDLGRTQTYRASSTVADGVNEQRVMERWRGGRAAYIILGRAQFGIIGARNWGTLSVVI